MKYNEYKEATEKTTQYIEQRKIIARKQRIVWVSSEFKLSNCKLLPSKNDELAGSSSYPNWSYQGSTIFIKNFLYKDNHDKFYLNYTYLDF